MKKIICSIVCIVMAAGTAFAAGAVLKLPEAIQTIEEETFYGDTSLYEVVVPSKLTRIEQKAFAYSSVVHINLPDSIEYIADDAFDGCHLEYAKTQSDYCKKWCTDHGIRIYSSDDNETGMFTDF